MQWVSPLPVRTKIAVAAGRATAELSKRLGKGEGSVVGGRVSLILDPRALDNLAVGRTVALVSGTNGKTTTTSMLAAALGTMRPVATNLAGANMYGGMVSALSTSTAGVAVLETDEGHLPKTLAMTEAQLVVLLNLSRDQLDRVGEVRMQAQKWREALADSTATVVANADDPLVVWAAEGAQRVLWVAGGSGWRLDAASCPNCSAQIAWDDDDWRCTQCELRRPLPHARFDNKSALQEVRLPLDLKIPGEVNQRNATVAITAAVALGADPAKAAEAVSALEGAGGRFATVELGGAEVRLILAKNPAGWTEALRIVERSSAPVVVAINARVQDGRDPSWLWDVPFEQLEGRHVVATGERGRDVAVRLDYAEVEHEFVEDMTEAVRVAQQLRPQRTIDFLGNYSAFQDARKLASQ